jgi:hypothetical protein
MPEEKPVDMDELARDLYVEMCGPIRNLGTPIVNLVALCKQPDVYSNLPESVRIMVDIAAKAIEEYKEANDRVEKIFQRLPPPILEKYGDYIDHKKR